MFRTKQNGPASRRAVVLSLNHLAFHSVALISIFFATGSTICTKP
jgi:hypothetical protein